MSDQAPAMAPPKRNYQWKGLRVRLKRPYSTRSDDHFYPSDTMVVFNAFNGELDLGNCDYGFDDLRKMIRSIPRHAVEIIGPESAEQTRERFSRAATAEPHVYGESEGDAEP